MIIKIKPHVIILYDQLYTYVRSRKKASLINKKNYHKSYKYHTELIVINLKQWRTW